MGSWLVIVILEHGKRIVRIASRLRGAEDISIDARLRACSFVTGDTERPRSLVVRYWLSMTPDGEPPADAPQLLARRVTLDEAFGRFMQQSKGFWVRRPRKRRKQQGQAAVAHS